MLGEQVGDRTGDFLSGLQEPFLSSSFLIRDVMSKPRKGFWSGSLVGEVTSLLSLSLS